MSHHADPISEHDRYKAISDRGRGDIQLADWLTLAIVAGLLIAGAVLWVKAGGGWNYNQGAGERLSTKVGVEHGR